MPTVTATERLVQIIQALSIADSLQAIQAIVRSAARELTNADGASFVLRDGSNCYYADEDAIAPLWKGRRFLAETCVSGWVMANRTPVVIPDIYDDPRVPVAAYRPTFVKSLAMVPIRTIDPIGAIGVYWAEQHVPSDAQVRLLQALADSTAVVMESVRVRDELEERVRRRTRELEEANAEINRLSLVDELTGLHNRRGFFLLAEQERKALARLRSDAFLLFIDSDGLKQINDREGHSAGDELLRALARILVSTFRSADVIARLGGDEFCVFGAQDVDCPSRAKERFDSAIAACSDGNRQGQLMASSGIYTFPADAPFSLDEALARADQAMYVEKRRRRTNQLQADAPPKLRSAIA
jgi:diguanylate cyclase (GGDEF)-like protein